MKHTPVLLSESLEALQIKPDGIYVDGTLGRAGHSLEILKRLKTGRLIAIDCDLDAIEQAGEKLGAYKDKITIIHGNFKDTVKILDGLNINAIDGAIYDLGVSSPQLDDAARGFSYQSDAKLDMRMDKSGPLTAFEIINTWQEEKLTEIFFKYGEEKYSRQIAKQIINKRTASPINTTFELNEVIFSAIPAAARREKQHPSKRCFQALRIAVGDELSVLNEMIDTVPFILNHGGRLCVISFHSLEDRIVKRAFQDYAASCTCDRKAPVCICNKVQVLKIITKKPVTESDENIKQNPRARSAKLRVAERI
ncbi:MAG: 16S rRNA (cytosine(1402)-N(4))-methyltransferase RsmH [Oscillospiraceae bacterium]|nr:16S rRNA (cytosine(1402)-N(4))-methyltransferase RsmH [Oscillospiraceae bacterium]